MADVSLEAHDISQTENRQHYCGSLFRRYRQRQQRYGDAAQGATEAAFGQAGEEDRRQGKQQEIRKGHECGQGGGSGLGSAVHHRIIAAWLWS